MIEDNIKCKSFPVILLILYLNKEDNYYLHVYLENCAYKIVNKQTTDYFDGNLD